MKTLPNSARYIVKLIYASRIETVERFSHDEAWALFMSAGCNPEIKSASFLKPHR